MCDVVCRWCVLPPERPLSDEAVSELRGALGQTWLLDEDD